MKKKWLAIGIAAIILAGVFFVGGMSYLEWDFSRLDGEKWEQKEFAAETENLDSASINVFSSEVQFVQGDSLKVEYEESDRVTYNISYENGQFTLKEHYKWRFRLFNFRSPRMTITLPKTERLILNSSNGDFNISDCEFTSLSVKLTNGDITLTRVDVSEKLSAENTNGSVSLWDVTAGVTEIDTNNGSVILKGVKSQTVSAETINGDVDATAVTADECNLSTVNGDISALKMTTINTYLSNLNGSISASFVFAYEDCRINTRTVNGETNVGNKDSGMYGIEAETVNGDIDLFFGIGA